MTNAVNLTVTTNKTSFPVLNTPQLLYVLMDVIPTEMLAQVRMPLNFALVLDRSGSMSGDKIKCVREAVKKAIDRLDDEDTIAIVTFESTTTVDVSSRPARDKGALKSQVDHISAGGGTTMAPAMKAGLQEIQKQPLAGRVNRLILLTDGQTVGEEDCRDQADEAGALGIPITALGVGDDWNDKLLEDIAEKSGGQSDQIKQASDIEPFFATAVQQMQAVAAQNAVLTLRLSQGVRPRAAYRVLPLLANLADERPLSDREALIELGELGKDQGQTLLVELLVDPRPAGSYRLAQAEVSYDIPALGLTGEKAKVDVVVPFGYDSPLNPRVMNIVEKATAFKLQTRALRDVEEGNIAGATQKLRAAATRLLEMGELELAQAAQQEAANLEAQGQMSAAGTKKLRYETRKLTQKLE